MPLKATKLEEVRGYAHILRNTVPVMQAKGVCEEMIHTIMVENPERLLTLV